MARTLSIGESCELALATFAVQMRSRGDERGALTAEDVERGLGQIPLQAAEHGRHWADLLTFSKATGWKIRKIESMGRSIFAHYFMVAMITDLWTLYRNDAEIAPYLPRPFSRYSTLTVN